MNQQEALSEDKDDEYKLEVVESQHSEVEKGNLEVVRQEGHVRHLKHEDALQRRRKRKPHRN